MFSIRFQLILIVSLLAMGVGCSRRPSGIKTATPPTKIVIRESATGRILVYDHEIDYYQWDRHAMKLNAKVEHRIGDGHVSCFKRNPTIELCVGGEVIYRGYLRLPHDQYSPNNIQFLHRDLYGHVLIELGKRRSGDDQSEIRRQMPDIRNNERLWFALKESNRLRWTGLNPGTNE